MFVTDGFSRKILFGLNSLTDTRDMLEKPILLISTTTFALSNHTIASIYTQSLHVNNRTSAGRKIFGLIKLLQRESKEKNLWSIWGGEKMEKVKMSDQIIFDELEKCFIHPTNNSNNNQNVIIFCAASQFMAEAQHRFHRFMFSFCVAFVH